MVLETLYTKGIGRDHKLQLSLEIDGSGKKKLKKEGDRLLECKGEVLLFSSTNMTCNHQFKVRQTSNLQKYLL